MIQCIIVCRLFRSKELSTSKSGAVSFTKLEDRVEQLESRWEDLNTIPTSSELFRKIKQLRIASELPELGSGMDNVDARESESAAGTHDGSDQGSLAGEPTEDLKIPLRLLKIGLPVHDMWQNMQIVKQIERNTAGLDKVYNPALWK